VPRIPALLLVLVTLLVLGRDALAPRPAAAFSHHDLAQGVFARMSEARAAAGRPALVFSPEAAAVAQARAEDMAANGYLEHISPRGIGPLEWLAHYGTDYRLAGENIGRGDEALGDLAAVMHNAWMASDGHRINVLEPGYGRAGIGIAVSGTTYYFAVVFLD
jgi:uncharacterized protein YkwD